MNEHVRGTYCGLRRARVYVGFEFGIGARTATSVAAGRDFARNFDPLFG